MPIDVLLSSQRGKTELEWLHSYHSFSFGQYFDPKRIGFGPLRVFNEDTLEPKAGFAPHPHDNMEIVTIILEGSLEHRDSARNQGILKRGDIQRMSAGSGIRHSEYNASEQEKVHFLQIWIQPFLKDLPPSYEQHHFEENDFSNRLALIVSPTSSEKNLLIHQESFFYLCRLDREKSIKHPLTSSDHGLYLFLISGKIKIKDRVLSPKDSAEIREESALEIEAAEDSFFLLVELPLSFTQ